MLFFIKRRFKQKRCRYMSEAERSQSEHRTVMFLQWNQDSPKEGVMYSYPMRLT